jgi:hypothetical protein
MKDKFVKALSLELQIEYHKEREQNFRNQAENARLASGVIIFLIELLIVVLAVLTPWDVFYSEDNPALLKYDLEFIEKKGLCNEKGAYLIVSEPYYKNLNEEEKLQVTRFFDYNRLTLLGLKPETLVSLPKNSVHEGCGYGWQIATFPMVMDGVAGPLTQAGY